MNRDKLLRDIELDLQTFQAHIKRMRKQGSVHRLDIDLLTDKTRQLYDQLFKLYESDEASSKDGIAINLPEKMPEAEIPEKVESKKGESKGTIVPKKDVEPVPKKRSTPIVTPPPVAEKVKEQEKQALPKEPKVPEQPVASEPPEIKEVELESFEQAPERVDEEVVPDPTPTAVDEPVKEELEVVEETSKPDKPIMEETEEDAKPQSAFDLFTSSASETIGDRLGGTENTSIADQMQQSSIADLKQAIGINEKFLFINELFNGDLGRYNKAIEEFNALQSREGVSAHLVELKVLNQWSEENEAYLKLQTLLDRKFG